MYVFVNYTSATLHIYCVHYKIPQHFKGGDKIEVESSYVFFQHLSRLSCSLRGMHHRPALESTGLADPQ